jgi:hypothetical protein
MIQCYYDKFVCAMYVPQSMYYYLQSLLLGRHFLITGKTLTSSVIIEIMPNGT